MLHNNYEVRWKNYKAFRDTGWIEIRPLTILIGPNNAGKTSIISPMLLLSQTMASRDNVTPLVTRGSLSDVGIFKNIIRNRSREREVYLGVRFHTHEYRRGVKKIGSYPPGSVEVLLKQGRRPEDIVLKNIVLSDIYSRPYFEWNFENGKYYFKNFAGLNFSKAELSAIQESKPVNFLFSPAGALSNYYDAKNDAVNVNKRLSQSFSHYVQVLSYSFEEIRDVLSGLTYIGPLRDRMRRHYNVDSEMPVSVGARGEYTAQLIRRRYAEVKDKLNDWLKRFQFGDSLHIENLADDRFSLSFSRKNPKSLTNIADFGFGASQVLPLIVQALAAERGSLTIAEQPEIHLNPKLQSVLAELLVEMANTDHRVVVETHSEHLLLRLRNLIAKNIISTDKVALYFVESDKGDSTIRKIDISPDGHIEPSEWPEGFFEDSLREALDLAVTQSIREG